MTRSITACAGGVLLAAILPLSSAWAQVRAQPASPQPLAVIVNRSNPLDGVSLAELRRVFMLETQSWPNGRKISVVLREKGQPERAEAIGLICGLSEREYDRHVLFQTFRGSAGWGPRSILSASAMLRFVFNAPGAIGYVPASQVDSTVKVLRVDGLLPGDPKYVLRSSPSQPGHGGGAP